MFDPIAWRTSSLVLGLLGAMGCRGQRKDATDAAPEASARAASPPIQWAYEGPTEVLYRGTSAPRQRRLIGVRPAEHQALVLLEGQLLGHARFGPESYFVIDYQAGRVLEERELTSSELRCSSEKANVPVDMRWSKLVHSFGATPAEVQPEPAFVLANGGKHLAYKPCERVTKGRAFVLAEADGQRPRPLGQAAESRSPSGHFSPDGRFFAWEDASLHVVDVSSGEVRDLGSEHWRWRWAPDSSRMFIMTSRPLPQNPTVCIEALPAPTFDKPEKGFCQGGFKIPSFELASDGKSAVLFGHDVDGGRSSNAFAWADLPSGRVKATGTVPDVAFGLMPLSRTPPILVGVGSSGDGINRNEWLSVRDAESGREGAIRWKPPIKCTYNDVPRWLDQSRMMMLCQGITNAEGFSPDYQLVAANVATAVGR